MIKTMKFKTRMDARGRTIIPRMIREAFKMSKGDTMRFKQKGNGVIVTVVKPRRAEAKTS